MPVFLNSEQAKAEQNHEQALEQQIELLTKRLAALTKVLYDQVIKNAELSVRVQELENERADHSG